jgi:hypothetical protein
MEEENTALQIPGTRSQAASLTCESAVFFRRACEPAGRSQPYPSRSALVGQGERLSSKVI